MTDETIWREFGLKNWQGLINISATLLDSGVTPPRYLFRGQPDAAKPLVPTLLRHFPPDCTAEQAIEIEQAALKDFRSQAHLHYPQGSLPSGIVESLFEWWALMQHHGAPTRLLDWTSSPYVAAYFACQNSDDKPGVIFVASLSGSIALLKKSFPTGKISNEDFLNPSAPCLLSVPELKKKTARLVAQQGYFTLSINVLGKHEELLADATRPLATAAPKNLFLSRLLIPAEQKPDFLKHLRAMNVTATALFPGFDGLGRSVAETVRLITRKMTLKNQKSDSA